MEQQVLAYIQKHGLKAHVGIDKAVYVEVPAFTRYGAGAYVLEALNSIGEAKALIDRIVKGA